MVSRTDPWISNLLSHPTLALLEISLAVVDLALPIK